jgi:hypothetical protein
MMDYTLRDDLRSAIDDGRVWFTEFKQFDPDVDIGSVVETVEDHAERVEQSVNCVAFIETIEQSEYDNKFHPSVQLAFVISRSADMDVLQRAFEEACHQIRIELDKERFL